ncbi:hypothetical protein CJ179_38590 [Rhodococcus sp. ACS1]|uniref:hypothetical protein n=1 Tax=Rhodococcus sp. ACS1 TaxID=2028570 RepID=UPI000BB12D66|nr:hypothetical protein [Rhodococcus sp. ACS1]PBC38509.1 hypothetical protein CJ179_38590 [Rhodococcus sp. ACS1]
MKLEMVEAENFGPEHVGSLIRFDNTGPRPGWFTILGYHWEYEGHGTRQVLKIFISSYQARAYYPEQVIELMGDF